MVISDEEQRQIQRRILHQVARRIGIERPEDMEEDKELFPTMEALDKMALRIMAGYRNAYQQWCVKSNELEQAARSGKPLAWISTVGS